MSFNAKYIKPVVGDAWIFDPSLIIPDDHGVGIIFTPSGETGLMQNYSESESGDVWSFYDSKSGISHEFYRFFEDFILADKNETFIYDLHFPTE